LPQFLVPRILFLHQNLTKNPCFAPFSLSIWLPVHDFSLPQKQLLAAKKHILSGFQSLKVGYLSFLGDYKCHHDQCFAPVYSAFCTI
jgi:hypothetical protein